MCGGIAEHPITSENMDWDIDSNLPVYVKDLLAIAERWWPVRGDGTQTLRELIEEMAERIGVITATPISANLEDNEGWLITEEDVNQLSARLSNEGWSGDAISSWLDGLRQYSRDSPEATRFDSKHPPIHWEWIDGFIVKRENGGTTVYPRDQVDILLKTGESQGVVSDATDGEESPTHHPDAQSEYYREKHRWTEEWLRMVIREEIANRHQFKR